MMDRCVAGWVVGGGSRLCRDVVPVMKISPGARPVMSAVGVLAVACWWRGKLPDRDANLLPFWHPLVAILFVVPHPYKIALTFSS